MNPTAPSKRPAFSSYAWRYALIGTAFGALFPLLATLLELRIQIAPMGLASAIALHRSNPLLPIIDTAPFILGIFAYLAGLRQDAAYSANLRLREREIELERINGELQGMRDDFEIRVRERTDEIESRTRQLEAVSKVARAISSIQELERLLPLISEVVSGEFGFYHTGIFLVDERHEFAVLQATNSEGGKRMLERGHRLRLGTSGIVGFVAGRGQPRIALDVEADSAFFNNPDLPETRSEMALPLKINAQTIGVLDVQSTERTAFSERDIGVLSVVANQIAIAIENARHYGQTRQALAEAQTIYQQYVRSDWAHYISKLKNIGYSYDGIRTLPVTNIPSPGTDPSIFEVPIRVRGQVIGNVLIRSNSPERKLSESEISLAQAAADRAALAIENARLLANAQRLAAKEHTIADITSKVGASIKLENIMQIAVEELGRALPGSEVVLQFAGRDEMAPPK